ncbi:MAG: nitrile hydratase subunit beta [Gammaproteobacteria bacterium]
MKLQHALGGLENLGPVNVEPKVFVQPWERRIFGIHTVMMAESSHLKDALPRYPVDSLPVSFKDTWTWASLRTGAEGMHPFEYFKFRYYEKWLMGISQFFIDKGYISPEELAEHITHYRDAPSATLPDKPNPALQGQIADYLMRGDSGLRDLKAPPRFADGQTVKVADPPAADHTRLPGYLRNKTGVIDEVYAGAFEYFVPTYPDGLSGPMPVYRVAFGAAEIWGPQLSEPGTTIYADLFEAYLRSPSA